LHRKDCAEALSVMNPMVGTARANKSSVLKVLVMPLSEHGACRRVVSLMHPEGALPWMKREE
jgi:hypothetical protein